MLAALVAGAVTGGLFRWESGGSHPDLGAADIFVHNALLGVLIVLLSAYVAWPVVLFNSYFVGLVLHANVVTEGWAPTVMLTAVHVPIEMAAWLVTLRLSVMATALVSTSLSRRSLPTSTQARGLLPFAGTATVLYLLAATAEWLELWFYLGKGLS